MNEKTESVPISPSVPPRDIVAGEEMPTDDSSFLVPGVSEFANLQPEESPPAWSRGLNSEDIAYMRKLGTLTTSGLIVEVKKLHDLAYQLGSEEAKEMTRGMYLNIFARRKRQ